MKKYFFLTLASCFALGAWAADENPDSIKGFKFTDQKTIKTTSVKDQNRSGTCWAFAGTSFVEDEIMRQGGDSLDLSEMFTVRNCYDGKAQRYIRYYGDINFSPGGSITDVVNTIKTYGAMPENAYPGLNYGEAKHDHSEFHNVMESMLKVVKSKPMRKISTAWKPAFGGILDAYLGTVPETFTYNGKTYTPKSFAESLPFNPDDYEIYTSFTHHPYYESFILEIPDNWTFERYMNIPLDELKAIVDNALENGYPINWAADVSEGGFKWNKGVALMPKGKDEGDMTGTELARWVKLSDSEKANNKYNFEGPVDEIEVTPELRQQMLDSQETTDDHGMEIVGIATDQNGKRYYKVKNSWDANQVYDGFIYVSEPFLLAKTMSLMVHKDAVPKNIAKKVRK